jgi:hypothetical protein
MSPEQQLYHNAEVDLCNWIDNVVATGVPMTAIVFMLQFRIFDINQQTLLHSQMIGEKVGKAS